MFVLRYKYRQKRLVVGIGREFSCSAPRRPIIIPWQTHDGAIMTKISGKRAFLALLKQEGVDILFGNPGTTELPLMDALAVERGLRYILGLQEAAVLAMADGYAQASGKLTVVNLHVAPGLGNAMGMLYDAQKAGSPLLVTAGQHDQSFTFSEPLLWADLPTIARPLVKWSSEVRRLADLPRAVHRAAKTALAPPTGPVFLSLPADVLNEEADIDLGAPSRVALRPEGERGGRRAARLCRTAGADRRRRGRPERRPCRARRVGRAAGCAGLGGGCAEHRLLPRLASAVPRRDDAVADRHPRYSAPA
jgi:hypothetical protein